MITSKRIWQEVYDAIERAGRELATRGKISRKTERIASQDIIPVPFFKVLKKFNIFKRKALQKIREGSFA